MGDGSQEILLCRTPCFCGNTIVKPDKPDKFFLRHYRNNKNGFYTLKFKKFFFSLREICNVPAYDVTLG